MPKTGEMLDNLAYRSIIRHEPNTQNFLLTKLLACGIITKTVL
jgi:hypothetical protein